MNKFLYYSRLDTKGSLAMLFLRLVAGSAFVFHGWLKIQEPFTWLGPNAPINGYFQALAAFSEFGGGIAWSIGFLMPFASLGMLIMMSMAVYFRAAHGEPFVGYDGSYESSLGYAAMSFLLLMIGPGRFALDAILFGSKLKKQ
ncbi:MAG: DoxX family protein [Candidatus Obscuribacterales bacterium]|nr:DoxX family protein [Candidatus Obscuribacterales bacterium]